MKLPVDDLCCTTAEAASAFVINAEEDVVNKAMDRIDAALVGVDHGNALVALLTSVAVLTMSFEPPETMGEIAVRMFAKLLACGMEQTKGGAE